jgi:CHAT domain-containing protein
VAQDVRQLTPGAAIERDLAVGQSHTYQLTVGLRDLVHLEIDQQGMDVLATLTRPDGQVVTVANETSDEFCPETLIAIPEIEGRYTVDVRPARTAGPAGRYAIRIEALRPATPTDAMRIDAERAYARGQQLRRGGGVASNWPLAIAEFDNALARFRGLDERAGILKTLIWQAEVQTFLLRPEALASAQEAKQIAVERGDRAQIALALRMVGLALERAGDSRRAIAALTESAAIARDMGNRRAEMIAVNSEGNQYGRLGDAERAVSRLEHGIALARAISDRGLEMIGLNNIGIAYRDLGEYEKSLNAYRQVLADDHVSSRVRATTLNNMGNLERRLERPENALPLHTEALALSRTMGDKELEARSLNTLGLTYFSTGDSSRALEFHRDALVIRRQMNDLPGQAASLNGAGLAQHRLGDRDVAVESLEEALAIRRRIREQYGEGDTLRDLAIVERDRGRLAVALGHIQAGVDLEEMMRARVTSPELRASFASTGQDKYALLIDLLQQQHQADPSGGHTAAALQVSERARARVLLESLLEARVDLREGIEPALLNREQSLQKELNDASASLSRTLGSKGREELIATGSQRVERLTAEYQQLQTEIRQRSPRYAAITQPQPLTLGDVQAVIDDETVLLEFALGDERSWLWAVTPHSIDSIELPPRRVVDEAARLLYEQFTARQKHPGAAGAREIAAADARLVMQAAAVSTMLFGRIAPQLNGEWRDKRLAIVAAGALEYLPFSALPVPGAAPGIRAIPLIATHEIVTLPSASVLAMLRRDTVSRPPGPTTVAILADPVFEASDPRVTSASARAPAVSGLRGDDTFEFGPLRTGFARLPFSREEANAIASLAGERSVFKATDFRASRATVLDGTLQGHRIVHFATHGVLDNQRPALSGLILSLFDERGAPQNGFLRLHDIYNMRLDADLVVLSACQTALGKEIRGEGLVGLTRAFMYAGAPRVVATLWQVSDLATAELMKRFYRGVLQQKLPPSAALRAAQRQMARDPRWASPYYWAGFVMQGDWR